MNIRRTAVLVTCMLLALVAAHAQGSSCPVGQGNPATVSCPPFINAQYYQNSGWSGQLDNNGTPSPIVGEQAVCSSLPHDGDGDLIYDQEEGGSCGQSTYSWYYSGYMSAGTTLPGYYGLWVAGYVNAHNLVDGNSATIDSWSTESNCSCLCIITDSIVTQGCP